MKRLRDVLRLVPLLIAIPLGDGSAWGRAVLVESVPADGEVLARAPSEVTLRFDTAIEPRLVWLNLSDVRGTGLPLPMVHRESAPTDRLTVVLPLLGRGSYILHYRVLTGDGEATYGTLRFTTGGY